MSERVVVGTVPNMDLGRMYQDLFRQAGIPVSAMASGVEFYAAGAADLWLEDDRLLQDPDVAAFIDDVLHRDHSRAVEIEQPDFPLVEPETPPTAAWPGFWYLASLAASYLLPLIALGIGFVLAWLFYRTFF